MHVMLCLWGISELVHDVVAVLVLANDYKIRGMTCANSNQKTVNFDKTG